MGVLVYRGTGFFVVLSFCAFFAGVYFSCKAAFGQEYFDSEIWPCSVILAGAGISCVLFGRWIKGREYDTGFGRGWKHDLCYIPIEWWGAIMIAGAVLVWFYEPKPRVSLTPAKASASQVQRQITITRPPSR